MIVGGGGGMMCLVGRGCESETREVVECEGARCKSRSRAEVVKRDGSLMGRWVLVTGRMDDDK